MVVGGERMVQETFLMESALGSSTPKKGVELP